MPVDLVPFRQPAVPDGPGAGVGRLRPLFRLSPAPVAVEFLPDRGYNPPSR
ncbi:MAG: hypothetical protein KA419_11640 [Acidobacteria bacterium]|nr:hypothetical protein [Acidobacteriota bacterium]